MSIKSELFSLGLDEDNSIVIGSGILDALGIRKSNDIDVVVKDKDFQRLKGMDKFNVRELPSKEIIYNDLLEIGTSWSVLDEEVHFEQLYKDSVVIEGVRYSSLDSLYVAKVLYSKTPDVRQKDLDDIRLIEEYLKKNSKA